MDRKTIEDFEKEHYYTLQESYIKFLIACDNNPQSYCKDYEDISLYSMEELPEIRKMHEMDKYCPKYIAIDFGGGEVLIMKQERDSDMLIVTEAGNLISNFITPEYCKFFDDFFSGWVVRKCPANEIDSMYE